MSAYQHAEELLKFLNTLPDIEEYKWRDEDGCHITNEWLCGTFAGRGFKAPTFVQAAKELGDYLDRHIGHKSMVGDCVTESGWPDLERVKAYLIANIYSEEEQG